MVEFTVVVVPDTCKSPAIIVVDPDPAPIVTSTCPSWLCSPSRISPAVNWLEVPLLSATKKDNFPASSVSADSETSATIEAKFVCSCAELSPVNSIVPTASPSAAAAPLSFTNCSIAPLASFVVSFIVARSRKVLFCNVSVDIRDTSVELLPLGNNIVFVILSECGCAFNV